MKKKIFFVFRNFGFLHVLWPFFGYFRAFFRVFSVFGHRNLILVMYARYEIEKGKKNFFLKISIFDHIRA